MRDPDLIAFTREKKIEVGPPLSGNELEALVDETLAMPQAVVALAKMARRD
jgi:hypothetical protein